MPFPPEPRSGEKKGAAAGRGPVPAAAGEVVKAAYRAVISIVCQLPIRPPIIEHRGNIVKMGVTGRESIAGEDRLT